MNQSGATSVVTWDANPIQLQAGMGWLRAIMFLLNMPGALVLLPALTHFLKPSALQRSTDAKAAVQLAGESA